MGNAIDADDVQSWSEVASRELDPDWAWCIERRQR